MVHTGSRPVFPAGRSRLASRAPYMKRTMLIALVCGWALDGPSAVAQQTSVQTAPVREIESLIDRQTGLLLRRDAAGLAALFTQDAIYVGATGAIFTGTESIRDYYAQTFATLEQAQSAALIGDFTRDNKVYQVQALGDGAWALGRGSLLVNGPFGVVARSDHWTGVFTKVGNEWKIRMMSVGEDVELSPQASR